MPPTYTHTVVDNRVGSKVRSRDPGAVTAAIYMSVLVTLQPLWNICTELNKNVVAKEFGNSIHNFEVRVKWCQ